MNRSRAVGLLEISTRLETSEVRNATKISDFLVKRVEFTNTPEKGRKWWPFVGHEMHTGLPNI
jgi:hypothetical protein